MSKQQIYPPWYNPQFREVFNDEFTTRKNGGVPTNVTFSNGVSLYNGINSVVSFNNQFAIKSIRFKVKLNSTTEDIINLSSTQSITASSGILNANGISSHTIYVDGVESNVIGTNWAEIVITTSSNIFVTDFKIGFVSSYLNGSIDDIEMYCQELTSEQVELLYNGNYYQDYKENLLLDYDSTRGVIECHTGLNTLTSTDVELCKQGSSYSAMFNGDTSFIDTGSDFIGTKAITVCGWINLKSYGEIAGRIIDNEKFFIYALSDQLRSVSDGTSLVNSGSSSISLNTWQFISITREADGTTNFYIGDKDTAPTLSGSADQDAGTPVAGTANAIIGNNSIQIRTLDGFIPRIRVYKGVLSLEEITRTWNKMRRRLM